LDPIDVVTGECYVERTDFSLPGPIPVEWKAYYSNQIETDGPLGWGWTHSYHCYIEFYEDYATYVDGEDNETLFLPIPEAGDTVESGDNLLLRAKSDESSEITFPEGLTFSFREFTLDGDEQLEKIYSPNGHAVNFFYNKFGYLISIIDSANRVLNLETDRDGRILSITCFRKGRYSDSLKLVTYRYDNAGNLVEVTDVNGFKYFYKYDLHHRLIKRTDRNGYSFHYQYAGDRCVKTWGDDGLYSGEFIYEPDRRRTFFTGFDGRRIEYRYNQDNMVTEEIDPYGKVAKTIYDLNGNVVAKFDRCDRANSYKYDERGNKVEETEPTGKMATYLYNKKGQIIEKTDHLGVKTVYEYDDRGNLIS